jgi:hypothetical protein
MSDEKPFGVLFVHGIGNQAQGDTLLGCAEPLYQWLVRWLEGEKPKDATGSSPERDISSSVHIIDAAIQASNDSPAHTEWLLRIKQENGEIKETRLLLAEAWWAGSITAASFWSSLKWALQVGPSISFLHFSTLINNVKQSSHGNFYFWLFSLLAIPFYILASIILMLLVTGLALTLAIASAISSILPFAWLRSLVTNSQFILSNWIGDAYLLTMSPIQFAVMKSKFRQELNWLDDRCEKIVVVAHSQGTAIAYHALLENKPASVQHLVTYGSAIKLLDRIDKIRSQGLDWLAIIFTGILLFIPIYFYNIKNEWLLSLRKCYDPNRDYLVGPWDLDACFMIVQPVIILITIFFVFSLMFVFAEGVLVHNPLSDAHRLGQNSAFRWIDLYASHDPAPNGPIFDKLPDFIQSKSIHNHANLITDHSTYWSNIDQFVTTIACVISDLSGVGFAHLTKNDNTLIIQAHRRRIWRIGWLSAARNLFLLSCTVLVLNRWNQLTEIGERAVNVLGMSINKIPGTEEISRSLYSLNLTGQKSLGVLAILAVPIIWYFCMRIVWNLWEKTDVGRLFKRQSYDYGGAPFILFFSLMASFLVFQLMTFVYNDLSIGEVLNLMAQNVIGYALFFLMPGIIIFSWLGKEKFIRAAVSATLLAALILSLLTLLGIWDRDFVFRKLIPSIFIITILFELMIEPKWHFVARFTNWLTNRSLYEPRKAAEAGIHAKKLNTFVVPIKKYIRGSIGFLTGITALIFSLSNFRLDVSGLILLLSYLSFTFSVFTLVNDWDSKFLRSLSFLGLLLALVSPILFWFLAFIIPR